MNDHDDDEEDSSRIHIESEPTLDQMDDAERSAARRTRLDQANYRNQSSRNSASGSRPGAKKADLSAVDKVLPSVLAGLGLDKRLKEHSFMQMWASIAPANIANHSRPLFLDSQHNLVITVSDASVAQEISLTKGRILPTLHKLAKSLSLNFVGIRIDLKQYHQPEAPVAAPREEPLPVPSEAELSELQLRQYDIGLMQDLSNKLTAENTREDIAVKVMEAFDRRLRIAQWRRYHGYPVCQNCQSPVSRLHDQGASKVCFICMMQTS